MKRIVILIACILTFIGQTTSGQISHSLNGYVSNMQSVMFENIDGQWISDNLFHNRINGHLYFGNHVELAAEIRNRMMYGESVKFYPGYADMINQDNGWQDWSWNLVEDSSWLLNTTLDRLYADLTFGKLQITAGRQRINWGVNFVWNPNDLFNTYSIFDFDYIEKPGSDAIRIQYYLSSTAAVELAAKINSDQKYSAASLFRFNVNGTDFQLLAGLLNEEEYVLGAGFSGYLGPVSVSGEMSYLDPYSATSDNRSAWLAGLGLSYNTPFNLFIQTEYLYNQAARDLQLNSFQDFYFRDLSIRDLSVAPHSFFVNLSYPVTPLLNLGASSMLMTGIAGMFIGPSVDLSLRNDLDLSLIVQHFQLSVNQNKEKANLAFLRLKWSF